jgi:hypothetical protein
MVLHRQVGTLTRVLHRRVAFAISWFAAGALAFHPLFGLSPAGSANAAPVQWLTICTMQGISQMPLLLSTGDETPSPAPDWTCPDCVPTPPAGALLAYGDAQVLTPASPAIFVSAKVLKPVATSTDPAHRPRAPPLHPGLNS